MTNRIPSTDGYTSDYALDGMHYLTAHGYDAVSLESAPDALFPVVAWGPSWNGYPSAYLGPDAYQALAVAVATADLATDGNPDDLDPADVDAVSYLGHQALPCTPLTGGPRVLAYYVDGLTLAARQR